MSTQTTVGARRRLLVCIATITILTAAAIGARQSRLGYRPRAGDDRPPPQPQYEAALRRGLAGDYAGAEAAFLTLAKGHRGTNAAAWSLYQASLAAAERGDRAQADHLRAELTEGYPGHPVVLRLSQASAGSPPERPKADCGPRALQSLCEAAGRRTGLQELKQLCKTDTHGTTLEGLVNAARAQGLRVAPAQVDHWYLRRHRPAGLAWVDGNHYVAFFPGSTPDQFWLADPNLPQRQTITAASLRERSQGIVLLAAWGDRKLPPGLEWPAAVGDVRAGGAKAPAPKSGAL